jgi:hypothetical protein
MPVAGTNAASVLGSQYAAFSGMDVFRYAFEALMSTPHGEALYNALAVTEKPSVAWRSIRSLNWPGNQTETNYPSAVLDLIPGQDRPIAGEDTSGEQRTSGLIGITASGQQYSKVQATATQDIGGVLLGGAKAIQGIIRKVT